MQHALEAIMSELVFGPPLASDAVDAWLAQHGLSPEDQAAIRADFERIAVYRSLVRGTLRDAVELAIPRTLARLGGVFDEYFARFLAERGPRTHYLRDVTMELLDFCTPLWTTDARVPAWTLDLARHEALQIVVASEREVVAPRELGELELERGLRFVAAARVARYAFAVHRLSSDESDRTPPEYTPTALFVYRDPEHDVRYLELSPLAASLVERLLAGASLKDAVLGACGDTGIEPSLALDGTARLLADLAARGALLGPTAPNAAVSRPNTPDSAPDGGAHEPPAAVSAPGTPGLPRTRENSTMTGRDKEPHERS